MNLIYTDQSASELRLNLIDGVLDKTPLNVILTDTLHLADIYIEAGIIGASHFVSFNFGDKVFSEVFACLELSNSSDSCFVGKVFKQTAPIKYFKKGLFSYEFTSEILDWDDKSSEKYKNFENEVEKSSDDKESIGLSYAFPTMEKNKFLAKTEVKVTKVNDMIIVETLHAYPNEEKLVFTETQIKIL